MSYYVDETKDIIKQIESFPKKKKLFYSIFKLREKKIYIKKYDSKPFKLIKPKYDHTWSISGAAYFSNCSELNVHIHSKNGALVSLDKKYDRSIWVYPLHASSMFLLNIDDAKKLGSDLLQIRKLRKSWLEDSRKNYEFKVVRKGFNIIFKTTSEGIVTATIEYINAKSEKNIIVLYYSDCLEIAKRLSYIDIYVESIKLKIVGNKREKKQKYLKLYDCYYYIVKENNGIMFNILTYNTKEMLWLYISFLNNKYEECFVSYLDYEEICRLIPKVYEFHNSNKKIEGGTKVFKTENSDLEIKLYTMNKDESSQRIIIINNHKTRTFFRIYPKNALSILSILKKYKAIKDEFQKVFKASK